MRLLMLPSLTPAPRRSTLFPYTTLFRSVGLNRRHQLGEAPGTVRRRAVSNANQRAYRGKAIAHYQATGASRSEEHTSELQSHLNLVCRLLLEKKKGGRYDKPLHTLTTLR